MVAFKPAETILAAFVPTFVAAGRPNDTAIFQSRHDLRANLITVYFSPRAATIAHASGAPACAEPARDDRLTLRAGPADSFKTDYPGTEGHRVRGWTARSTNAPAGSTPSLRRTARCRGHTHSEQPAHVS